MNIILNRLFLIELNDLLILMILLWVNGFLVVARKKTNKAVTGYILLRGGKEVRLPACFAVLSF